MHLRMGVYTPHTYFGNIQTLKQYCRPLKHGDAGTYLLVCLLSRRLALAPALFNNNRHCMLWGDEAKKRSGDW